MSDVYKTRIKEYWGHETSYHNAFRSSYRSHQMANISNSIQLRIKSRSLIQQNIMFEGFFLVLFLKIISESYSGKNGEQCKMDIIWCLCSSNYISKSSGCSGSNKYHDENGSVRLVLRLAVVCELSFKVIGRNGFVDSRIIDEKMIAVTFKEVEFLKWLCFW
jgi:hypothetical protein